MKEVDNFSVSFRFLNLEKKFENFVDWNYTGYSKLWTYNLNYFEFLEYLPYQLCESLIYSFTGSYNILSTGREPYPTSLRTFNLIRFSLKNNIQYADSVIATDLLTLRRNIELDLRANHLLENAVALYIGAQYFSDVKQLKVAKKLLLREIDLQFFNDGGHFERSPMYHFVLTNRLLDLYILVSKFFSDGTLIKILENKLSKSVSFAWSMTINNSFPLFHDSAPGVAIKPRDFFEKARMTGVILNRKHNFMDSGFRKLSVNDFLLIADCGEVSPDYQPGHHHASFLSFVLFFQGKSILIDPGVTTYDPSPIRLKERSTINHNTITIDEASSAEIWGGFRMGNRPEVLILKESEESIAISHNGYSRLGITHNRSFYKDYLGHSILIRDEIIGNAETSCVIGSLHFDYKVTLTICDSILTINGNVQIAFTGVNKLWLENGRQSLGFNSSATNQIVRYTFNKISEITINEIYR